MVLLFLYSLIINCSNIVWFNYNGLEDVDIYLSLKEETLDPKTKILYNVANNFLFDNNILTTEMFSKLLFNTSNPFKALNEQDTENILQKCEISTSESLSQNNLKNLFIKNKIVLKATIEFTQIKNYSVEKVTSHDEKDEYVRERYFFDFDDNDVFFCLDDENSNKNKRIIKCNKKNGSPNEKISFEQILSKQNCIDFVDDEQGNFYNFFTSLNSSAEPKEKVVKDFREFISIIFDIKDGLFRKQKDETSKEDFFYDLTID